MRTDSEPSGIRLMRLINTISLEIAKREFRNDSKMCLYSTGEYWTAFEHSAYFLSRIFPNLESFVVNHPGYPYTIVGLSVSDKTLQRFLKSNSANRKEAEYMEFIATPFAPQDYLGWHDKKVKGLTE